MLKTIAIKLLGLSLIASTCNLCASDMLIVTAKRDINESENVNVLFQVKTSVSIKIETASLPWFNPGILTMVVVRAGTGECLKRVYLPQSPVFGNTQLKAHEICEGRLDLEGYFPNLKLENNDHDLIFFWHWFVPNGVIAAVKNKEDGYGGWLLLRKRQKGAVKGVPVVNGANLGPVRRGGEQAMEGFGG